MKKMATLLTLFVTTTSACGIGYADEWPKWLGPYGNGITKETGLLDIWPEGGPEKVWSQQVGLGFSSPIAVGGTVFMFAMQGDQDVLTALDAKSGKVLWHESYTVNQSPSQPQAMNEANHLALPDATPTVDGDRIYTYGGGSDLVCRSIKGGKQLWKLNVFEETHSHILAWNAGSSPLVTDKLVYVQSGDGGPVAVAVDKMSGKIAWRSEASGIAGYAAPIIVTAGGKRQLIVFAGKALFGMDPATGKTLWTYPWSTAYDVNASTPVYRDGHVFITTSYGHGCGMLALDGTGVKLEWEGKEVASKYQPVILDGDKLYANSDGRLKCLQWPTKKVLWKTNEVDLGEGGSFVLAGDKMIAISEHGKLSLLRVKPDGIQVASEFELFHGEKIWSTPLIYDGKLYAKGKNELVCLKISGK